MISDVSSDGFAMFHISICTRWAIIWRMTEGKVGVKCGLTVRGFKGIFQDLDTYAGTICRSGQRSANAVTENEYFILFRFDVRQAFAKRLKFKGLNELTYTSTREIQFDVPNVDLDCSRQIKRVETFNPLCEMLITLKQIYGLKGVPRAWRKQNINQI